jgi:arylsulfatase A-like enzyme
VASFPLERRFGFVQGFETYDDGFDRSIGDHAWMGEEAHGEHFYALARSTTRRALAALDGETRPDQFLWVHYFDPHCPYGDSHMAQGEPAPPWGLFSAQRLRDEAARGAPKLARMIRRARTGYARDLGFLDAALARLLQRLDADAERYETHVVIVGDHGESFGEDGSLGHGTRVTRAQIQVPLAVVSPRARPARRTDAAGSVDVFATLLDLAGLPAPDGRGRTLLGPPDPAGGQAFGMRRTWGRGAVDQRVDGSVRPIHAPSFYAYVQGRLLTGAHDGPVYSSPGGRLREGELAEQAQQLFGRFASALEGVGSREVDDEGTLEALRALGYTR